MTQDKPNKSAMMELVEIIDFDLLQIKTKLDYDRGQYDALAYCKHKATELLEKEKTQIVDAWIVGYGESDGLMDIEKESNKYFDQTYKQ